MSNLCHNCGATHLPQPCNQPLRDCRLCSSAGHLENFCWTGYTTYDPDYKMPFLCHACAIYHLPQPCSQPPVSCTTCGNIGHLPFYCPFQPTYREPYLPAGLHITTEKRLKNLELNVASFVLTAVSRGEDGATILRRIQDLRDHSGVQGDSMTVHESHEIPHWALDQVPTSLPFNHNLDDRYGSHSMQAAQDMEFSRREQTLDQREADLDKREQELQSQAETLEMNMRWHEYQAHQQVQHKPTRLNWPVHPTTETNTKPATMAAQVRRDSGVEISSKLPREHPVGSSHFRNDLLTAPGQPQPTFRGRREKDGQTHAQHDPRTEKEDSRTLTPPPAQGPTPIIVIPDSPTPDRDTPMQYPQVTRRPAAYLSPPPSTPASLTFEQQFAREHQQGEHADLFQLENEMIDAIGAELMELNQRVVSAGREEGGACGEETGWGGAEQSQSSGQGGDQGRVQSALERMGWTRARDGAA